MPLNIQTNASNLMNSSLLSRTTSNQNSTFNQLSTGQTINSSASSPPVLNIGSIMQANSSIGSSDTAALSGTSDLQRAQQADAIISAATSLFADFNAGKTNSQSDPRVTLIMSALTSTSSSPTINLLG